jgi:hypothetical protein
MPSFNNRLNVNWPGFGWIQLDERLSGEDSLIRACSITFARVNWATSRGGQLFDEQAQAPESIALRKRSKCSKALVAARVSRDSNGGKGVQASYHRLRDAQYCEAMETYEGIRDVRAVTVSRAQTGHQAFA